MINAVIRMQRVPVLGFFARQLLALHGIEIPTQIRIDRTVKLPHRAHGTVLSPNTRVGRFVTIYHAVTVARADSWVANSNSLDSRVHVGAHCILSPNSTVLFKSEDVIIGEGTVLAANSVLTSSTGEWEIWAGVPARKIGDRIDRPTGRDS